MKLGKVILVGAGPGDPGLLTCRGKMALEQAEVVVYDRLVGPGILGMVPSKALCIDVGKRAGNHPVPQSGINDLLLKHAQAGKTVVRLKGGDPFLFGRGGEELELLEKNGIPFEVVPGVTSALAVPTYAGIPVTHRGITTSVHIVTAHTRSGPEADVDYGALVRLEGTLVFLMGVTALPSIRDGLLAAGMDPETPAAALEKGTTAYGRRITAAIRELPEKAAEAELASPSIIVVGRVCGLAERFDWADKRPLGGMRIVVTRPRAAASALSRRLSLLGAEVVELPSIETVPILENPELDKVMERLDAYQWLVFTSPAGVSALWAYLRHRRMDARVLAGKKLAAIGKATGEALEDKGFFADLIPGTYSAGALGDALGLAARGERALLLRAKAGTPELTRKLEECGVLYDDVAVYETEEVKNNLVTPEELFPGNGRAWAAFTSASTVCSFAAGASGETMASVQAVCIGEQTAAEARSRGMRVVVAQEATMDAMILCFLEINKK